MEKLTIPPECMPVVLVLRRDVPRPKDLPVFSYGRFRFRYSCPMGLHKDSTKPCPGWSEQFANGECTHDEVVTFGKWWDSQTDAAAAVDAVWPREETTK